MTEEMFPLKAVAEKVALSSPCHLSSIFCRVKSSNYCSTVNFAHRFIFFEKMHLVILL